MNKKLIKQLEGVGFGYKNAWFIKRLNGFNLVYYDEINDFSVEKDGSGIFSIKHPTFPQILAAIKEHTGVDLTKKSKREEIEELKIKVKNLEDGIKSQNEAIEGLKISKPLEVIKEIANLALKLKEMELSKTFDNGGVIGAAHGGESVLSNAILDRIRNPKKEQEKKAFGVDDKVVINENAKGLYGFQIEAMEQQIPLTITRVMGSYPQCEYKGSNVGVFPAEWLSYASESKERVRVEDKHADKKPFEVGDRVVKNGDSKNFCDGSILEVMSLPYNNSCLCKSTQGADITGFVPSDELEHAPEESPKEKVLEFGDPLECLVSKFFLKIGQKVIFLRAEAQTPVTKDMRYIISTEGGLTYALRPNEVKPL